MKSAKIYYLIWFTLGGALVSIFPIYLKEINYTTSQISLFIAIPSLTLLTQPLWGYFIDKYKIHRSAAIFVIITSGIALALVTLNDSFIYVFTLYLIFNILKAPIFNVVDNLIISMCVRKNYPYGKIRIFASFAWGASLLLTSPIIMLFSLKVYFFFHFLFSIVCALLLLNVENSVVTKKEVTYDFKTEVKNLFKNKKYLQFLSFTVILGAFGPINFPYQTFLLQEYNAPYNIIAITMLISTILEIPILPNIDKLERKIGLKKSFLLSIGFILVKCLIYTFTTNIYVIMFFASFHGIAMGIYIPLAIRHLKEIVRDEVSTLAFMINTCCGGILAIFSTLLAGVIAEVYGINYVFLYCSFLMVICLLVLQFIFKEK